MLSTFGDARWKIENGEINKGREMYFAIYQAIAKDERRPGLYKEYAKDFFDLIIVDECHRGSAKDQSNWREKGGTVGAELIAPSDSNVEHET